MLVAIEVVEAPNGEAAKDGASPGAPKGEEAAKGEAAVEPKGEAAANGDAAKGETAAFPSATNGDAISVAANGESVDGGGFEETVAAASAAAPNMGNCP